MKTLVVDFETYYDQDYSLKKLATLEYIRSPEFLVHGAAVKYCEQPAEWLQGASLPGYFARVNWGDTLLVSHNSNFDNTILFEKYGVSPGRRVDTLAVCRALLSQDLDFDLDSICTTLGFGGKLDGGAALEATKGIRVLSPELEARLAEYAIVDAEREYQLFDLLYRELPEDQRELMDVFIRMSTEGVLRFDASMAEEGRRELEEERVRWLKAAGLQIDAKGKVPVLSSRDQFAQLLRDHGVEPPMKISARTGKETYAFSKQDPDFIALKENPDVAHFVEAKLKWSSNSAIKRLEKLVRITSAPPHTLPVQLNFSGAHTHRPSGGGGINMQNLNRGSKLRLAITAPPGHALVVVDSSQIELRVNMLFSKQDDMVELLTPGEYRYYDTEIKWDGADAYRAQAAQQYKKPPGEVTKGERNYGKVAELMLGFGAGAIKFRATCAVGPMGLDPIIISEEQAYNTVYTYRANKPYVKASWDWLNYCGLPALMAKQDLEYGPIVFEHEAILLPDGMRLLYPNLRYDENEEWHYGLNGVDHKIYGGKLQENIVQALAQVLCKIFMLHLRREFGCLAPIVHQVHDEIILCCPEKDAPDVMRRAVEIMSVPPSWWPQLPVRAEAGFDWRYSK